MPRSKKNLPAKRPPPRPSELAVAADVKDDLGHAAKFAEESDSSNTVRAYQADIRDWESYAKSAKLETYPISPAALAAYIGHLDKRGLKLSTIQRRCSAISRLHVESGDLPPTTDPNVKKVLKGLARKKGSQKEKKRALSPALLRAAMLHPDTSVRDKALLSFGFVTGMRRSEIVAIQWDDVERHGEGLLIHIRASKTDQAGKGQVVGLPYGDDPDTCPVRALLAWKDVSGSDALFEISDSTVNRVVKRAVALVGEDPQFYGAHSMRSGLLTTAAMDGVSLAESMKASRHKSADVAADYVQAEALKNKAHKAAVNAIGKKR